LELFLCDADGDASGNRFTTLMTTTQSNPFWTRAFVLLCIVQLLGYAQHFVLQPTIPIYVTHLGASPFVVGLVMASFAAACMLLRPLVGYWSDRWSEAGVMISGLLIQAASFDRTKPSCHSW
jgi:MFS family permease